MKDSDLQGNGSANPIEEKQSISSSVGSGHAQELIPAAAVSTSAPINDKKRILKERALRLARRPDTDAIREECLDVIEFMLAHERYAVEVNYVREVYPLKDLTPVPCTPSFVLGIMNVRGQVLSVTDIREFFNLPRKEITDTNRVLILKNNKLELGVLAEAVLGERKIPIDEVHPDVPTLRGAREQYVRGVTKERLIILDANKLLSDDGIVVHEEVRD